MTRRDENTPKYRGPAGAPPDSAARKRHDAKRDRAGLRTAQRDRVAAKRRQAIARSCAAGLAVVMLLAGVRLIALPTVTALAASKHSAEDYRGAANLYGVQKVFPNVVEPWKAYYNAGTALVRAEEFEAAKRELDDAYHRAENGTDEQRCMIQTNLSIAYELDADRERSQAGDLAEALKRLTAALAAKAAGKPYDAADLDPLETGTPAKPDDLRAEATQHLDWAAHGYATAKQIRTWPGCPEANRSEEREQQDKEAQRRLDRKRQDSTDAKDSLQPPPPGPAPDPSPNPSPSPSPQDKAEADRMERLRQQNEEANQAGDADRQAYENAYGEGGAPPSRNW